MNMYNVVVSIGNSDDKLTQIDWSRFCNDMSLVVTKHSRQIHFYGHSDGGAIWQNALWLSEMDDTEFDEFKMELRKLKVKYRQNSIYMQVGNPIFV